MPAPMPALRHGMSVDVEDWFQVQAFAGCIARADWEGLPRRVEANMDRILSRFQEAGVRATFFTLGWIAERHPALVRRIVADGHELASHGHGHARVDSLDPATFAADIRRAKQVLEDIGGVAVVGYRAPTFSIGPRNPWAFDVLAEQGHRYSSSVYPVRHDLYGAPDSPRFPYRVGPSGLWELPMTTLPVAGRNVPISGGGYFRLMPYPLYRQALRRYERAAGQPAVFYFHPWEIDPGQPRVAAASRLSRFRHTVNLGAMEGRLARLLSDFAWDRMDRAFAHVLNDESCATTPPKAA